MIVFNIKSIVNYLCISFYVVEKLVYEKINEVFHLVFIFLIHKVLYLYEYLHFWIMCKQKGIEMVAYEIDVCIYWKKGYQIKMRFLPFPLLNHWTFSAGILYLLVYLCILRVLPGCVYGEDSLYQHSGSKLYGMCKDMGMDAFCLHPLFRKKIVSLVNK